MALPTDFIKRTSEILGKEEFTKLEQALSQTVPVSIRFNNKTTTGELPLEKIDWCNNGYFLPKRNAFTFDPLFHAGIYYVQEASSMFTGYVINYLIQEPANILDLCAAPGGKSTHILSCMPKGSLLVSNEVIRNRCNILAENIIKWGNPNHIVTNNDPKDFNKLSHFFDVIVTDVPCSGEGMFRKDAESQNEWSVENVKLCAARSKRILNDIWEALKPGGILIYSTCTYNIEENEENLNYIITELGATPIEIPIKEEWNITPALKYDLPAYRFLPHKTKGEGFFLAAVRKNNDETIKSLKIKSKEKKKNNTIPFPKEWKQYILQSEQFTPEWEDSILRIFPTEKLKELQLIKQHLKIINAGIEIGELKGKNIIPKQDLALSTQFNKASFPSVELNYNDAIRFLKKEAFPLPDSVDKGYVLITYKTFPLGFMKNLNNRANNLYPQEWRIRSSYTPKEEETILL